MAIRIRNFPLVRDLPPPLALRHLDDWIAGVRTDFPDLVVANGSTKRNPDGSIDRGHTLVYGGQTLEVLGKVMLDGQGSLIHPRKALPTDPTDPDERAKLPKTTEYPMTEEGLEALVYAFTGTKPAIVPVDDERPRRTSRK